MKSTLPIWGAIGLAAASTSAPAYSQQASSTLAIPSATISAGVVAGTQTLLPSSTAPVNKFLGVPFAQSPPQRFAPPAPAPAFNGTLQAQAWRPTCIQQFQYPAVRQQLVEEIYNVPAPEESEDCLYLNIYAPSTPSNASRAVFVWIPAGELQFGNAGQVSYDGSAFAAYQDVIVVVPNFRTNLFGFPNSDQLTGIDQNPGYLDQRMAFEWIQANIAAFGGDPAKVTLGGVSSGAGNAELQIYNFPENPPFRAAILGSTENEYNVIDNSPNPAAWQTLARTVNCTTGDILACMRTVPAAALKNAGETLSLTFNPVPENYTLPSNIGAQIRANRFAHVPVLSGTTSQEGRFYAIGQTNLDSLITQYFNATPAERAQIPGIRAAYPVASAADTYFVLSRLITDYAFACPKSLWNDDMASRGAPVWQYLYNVSFPNTAFSSTSGAYHASEVRIVFQSYNGGPMYAPTASASGLIQTQLDATPEEIAVSRWVNGAWGQFIRDPEAGPGWPRLATAAGERKQVGVIGPDGVTLLDRRTLLGNCGLFLPVYETSPGVGNLSVNALDQ